MESKQMRSSIRTLNLTLAAALLSFGVWGYARLPERIPIHFDARGAADGWGTRTMFIVMPLLGIAIVAIMLLVTRVAFRNPHLTNIPDKKAFLALPAAEQQWVLEPMVQLMDWTSTLVLILFLIIQVSMYRGATSGIMGSDLTIALYVVIGLMLVLPLWLLLRMKGRVREAQDRSTSGAVPPSQMQM
jgi:uncharacterized membrane protein